MNKLLSIIIPVYNLEDYLENCVNSIIKQYDKDDIELIIINDGSTDCSLEKIIKLSHQDSRIIYKNIPNRGVSEARNLGLKLANGKYITFLDADDTITLGSLNQIISKLHVNLDIIILRSKTEDLLNGFFLENYRFDEELLKNQFRGEDLFSEKKYFRGSVTGVIFYKKFINDNNISFLKGIKNSEDTIFMFFCQYYASKIQFLNIDFYRVIKREGSASTIIDMQVALNQLSSIKTLQIEINIREIEIKNSPLLTYLFYQIISNSFHRFKKSRNSNFSLLKQNLEYLGINKILPLKSSIVPFSRIKIKILNNSPRLFYYLLR